MRNPTLGSQLRGLDCFMSGESGVCVIVAPCFQSGGQIAIYLA